MLLKRFKVKDTSFEKDKYLYKDGRVAWNPRCCVCDGTPNGATEDCAPIHKDLCAVSGEWIYLFPSGHRGCKRIFELNPLAYENTK